MGRSTNMRWLGLFIIIAVSSTALFLITRKFNTASSLENFKNLRETLYREFPELRAMTIRFGNTNCLINRTTIEISKHMNYSPEKQTFVILHELAHVFCSKIDVHDDEFMEIFDSLLRRADAANIPYQEAEKDRRIDLIETG